MPAVRKGLLISFITVFLILFIDQASKIWIKTHLPLSVENHDAPFHFRIELVENYGMAWGFSFGGETGKIILTLLRLVVSIVIAVYLYLSIRKKARTAFIIVISLILAGALGNIIDSMFYGMIFSESTVTQPAIIFPPGGGYGSFLHGRVVDFFSVKFFDFQWPVFNIADASITIGVLILLFFQKKLFKKDQDKEEPPMAENPDNNP